MPPMKHDTSEKPAAAAAASAASAAAAAMSLLHTEYMLLQVRVPCTLANKCNLCTLPVSTQH